MMTLSTWPSVLTPVSLLNISISKSIIWVLSLLMEERLPDAGTSWWYSLLYRGMRASRGRFQVDYHVIGAISWRLAMYSSSQLTQSPMQSHTFDYRWV